MDLGNMAYSAVTQPRPVPRRNGGTLFSTVAAQMTLVLPASISAEPSAVANMSGWMRVCRDCSGLLPSIRINSHSLPIARRSSRSRRWNLIAIHRRVAEPGKREGAQVVLKPGSAGYSTLTLAIRV